MLSSQNVSFQVKQQLESELDEMIVSYRDDPDLQSVIDWIQMDWVYLWLSVPFSDHAGLVLSFSSTVAVSMARMIGI